MRRTRNRATKRVGNAVQIRSAMGDGGESCREERDVVENAFVCLITRRTRTVGRTARTRTLLAIIDVELHKISANDVGPSHTLVLA